MHLIPALSRRRLAGSLAAALVLAGATLVTSCVMANSAAPAVTSLPANARDVVIPGNEGRGLNAWYAAGRPGGGAVLLLHGVGADRSVMRGRIAFLHAEGFAVLAPDFRAHGASGGGPVTYGRRESDDARDALAWLRAAAPGERVAAVGISMGGAATLLGDSALAVDALVLESVYPTIADAVRDRLRAWLGPLGAPATLLTPLATRVLGARAGVPAAELRPIDHIGAVRAPLLLLSGTRDPYTPIGESRALFARAAAPREMWEVEGATHEDLHAFAPADYEARVGGFLAARLRRARSAAGARVASSGTGTADGWPPHPEQRARDGQAP